MQLSRSVFCVVLSLGSLSSAVLFGQQHVDLDQSEMRPYIERFVSDDGNVRRFYSAPMSSADQARRVKFLESWRQTLASVDFDKLSLDGQIDYLLLSNEITRRAGRLEIDRKLDAEIAHLVPFSEQIVGLDHARRKLEPVDGKALAVKLSELTARVQEAERSVRDSSKSSPPKPQIARRAASHLRSLQSTLRRWHGFYNGYDPLFTWWTKKPYEELSAKLESYRRFLGERFDGKSADPDGIVGDPIGKEALLEALAREMIPYSPEELVAIAEREFAWCDREMARASRTLGFGDDWRKAQEHVKGLHVEPGEQPKLIAELAHEAVAFLENHELLTIPELCKETWRMQMMSAERQKVNPYFTGGEVISVSYPTDAMTHAEKLTSMRGNNIHFSRATVHHELIPGHHLQGFMTERYRTHRRVFRTPFWTEGWALYWEMLLWDLDFPRGPEDRVGMLFWRKHRCARIIFSLSYHLGTMSVQEAIDFLVQRVGHERGNAAAEVRRSVEGGYSPLYQAAYMLGGLQIRALYRDLVKSKKISAREFHDAVLRENAIPIELIRAKLTRQKLTRDFRSSWRFAD